VRDFRGYLFDLDGTLVDTAPDLNAALNHALTSHGLQPVDEALTRHWVGHGARVLVTQALAHQQRDGHGSADPTAAADLDALLNGFIDHYQSHIADHSKIYPGVVETLEALRAGGSRLAVVTNKRTVLTEALLEILGLGTYFDAVVCGDTAALPKPAADPAVYACRALNLPADQVLFVGDSATDVACARAAGCAVVCVADGYNHGTPAHELGADAVITSFRELLEAGTSAS